ncbi:MAG: hypothetical protein PVF53_23375 [Desulfobacterales bacterium]|jgi:hypothetical protein
MVDAEQNIIVRPSRIVCILALAVALLVLASTGVKVFEFVTGRHHVYGLIRQFYLYNEGNIPTFFSTFLLLISTVLLALIAVAKKRNHDAYAINWIILAFIFLYLSLDEAASIHEMFSWPVMDILSRKPEGALYHIAWTIPFIALLLILAVSYWKFLFHLPRKILLLFLTAGILYVGGAIGGEFLQVLQGEFRGTENLTYVMIITFEETLEMTGIVIFIHALLKYMSFSVKEVRFSIAEGG